MRRLLPFVACLLMLIAVPARAQGVAAPPSTATADHTPFAAQQSSFPRPAHRCCHLKGLLIGAGVGAAFGWWVVRSGCDASDCIGDYMKAMAVFGGIGGALGVFLDQQNRVAQPPTQPAFPTSRFRMSGVVTSRVRAATASVAF